MMQQYHNRARKDAEIRNRPAGLMQGKFLIFFMLCGFLLAAFSLHAVDGLEISDIETPQAIEYTGSTVTQPYTITVSFDKNLFPQGSADAILTFSAGSAGIFDPREQNNQSGDPLNYQLYDRLAVTDRNILKDRTVTIDDRNILAYKFNKTGEYTFEYFLEIPQNQNSASGMYEDTVTVTLYEGNLNNPQFIESREVTFKTTIPFTAELAVVQAGEPFNYNSTSLNLDFGFLAGGETMAFDILVKSNTHFDIKVQSQEGGSLAPVSLASDPSRINYFLDFSGSVFDLGTDQITVLQNADPVDINLNPDGKRFPVAVEIDAFDWPTSGEYQDTLTFTLQTE